MFNYKESFLKQLEFVTNQHAITGGYTYKVGDENDLFRGGSIQGDVVVPIGLVVNDYDDNLKNYDGEYVGVLGIGVINEFLDLNYKPIKRITRKLHEVISNKNTKKKH